MKTVLALAVTLFAACATNDSTSGQTDDLQATKVCHSNADCPSTEFCKLLAPTTSSGSTTGAIGVCVSPTPPPPPPQTCNPLSTTAGACPLYERCNPVCSTTGIAYYECQPDGVPTQECPLDCTADSDCPAGERCNPICSTTGTAGHVCQPSGLPTQVCP